MEQTYFYRITASNDGGESPRSSEVPARLGAPAQLMAAGALAAVDFLRRAASSPPGNAQAPLAVDAEA